MRCVGVSWWPIVVLLSWWLRVGVRCILRRISVWPIAISIRVGGSALVHGVWRAIIARVVCGVGRGAVGVCRNRTSGYDARTIKDARLLAGGDGGIAMVLRGE